MVRNLKITVEGRAYNVTVEDIDQPSKSPKTAPAKPLDAPKPAPAPAAAAAPAASAQPVTAGAGDVASPMTGVLIEYSVKVGDSVEVNQQVATIEAMKMKTAVIAHAAGKVTKLFAEPGSSVDTGQALLTIG